MLASLRCGAGCDHRSGRKFTCPTAGSKAPPKSLVGSPRDLRCGHAAL